MIYSIGHSQKKNRFEVECLGQTAFWEYIVAEGVMEIRHTIVPAELEGQGIGSALVKQALEYARDNHLNVTASCDFAENYILRHKEYGDLLLS